MCPFKKRIGLNATQLYDALVEALEELVFVVNRDGRYVMFNERSLRSFGFNQDEVLGKTPVEAFGKEIGDTFERNNLQVLKSGKPLSLQEWVPLSDGLRCISTLLTPVSDSRGRVAAVMGIGRDVTDMKRMMEEQQISVKKMESRFAQRVQHEQLVKDIIREAIPNSSLEDFLQSVVVILGQGLGVSRAYFFEYDQIHHKASNTHEWVAPGIVPLKDEMQHVPIDSQPWLSREMFAGRLACVSPDCPCPSPELVELLDSQGVNSMLAIPIFTFGNPFGFIGFDECTKKIICAEIDVELLQGVVRIIAQKIERNRLERDVLSAERLAAIGRLTASFTHEINNPLQSILLHLEGLRDHVDAEGQRNLDFVSDGFNRITTIVSRLMNVNRAIRDKTQVDINAVLRSAYKLLSHQIDLKGINVRWRLDENMPMYYGDEDKLHQVFINVMLNACDSIEKGGELNICTLASDCHIAVEIQDTGSGIDEDALPYIFEPFFTTKGKAGTGLGLFVSHSIVTEHGGRIGVESKPGSGTTVQILLPLNKSCEHLRRVDSVKSIACLD
ncbi:MAG: ATP-binding protein [bacterium]